MRSLSFRALLNAGIFDFKVIKQNELPVENPLRKLSSPSVLKGQELIYGIRTNGEITTCTFDYINFVDETSLVKRFKELTAPYSQSNRSLASVIGAGVSTLSVLKCRLDASTGLYIGKFHFLGSINQFITYGSVAGLIASSIWDLQLKNKKRCPTCVSP